MDWHARACEPVSVPPASVQSATCIVWIPDSFRSKGVPARNRKTEREIEEREREGIWPERFETRSGPLFLTWVQPRFVNTSRHSLRVLFIGSGKLLLNAARKFEMREGEQGEGEERRLGRTSECIGCGRARSTRWWVVVISDEARENYGRMNTGWRGRGGGERRGEDGWRKGGGCVVRIKVNRWR